MLFVNRIIAKKVGKNSPQLGFLIVHDDIQTATGTAVLDFYFQKDKQKNAYANTAVKVAICLITSL
ncbi:hypothetical protein DRF60_06835 [Chryseobacterium elymi]|uniref:Uncharacterized protein n=1 Tax=Chryseobacterium elymi TaxID=395936 RepID=A0A3D9DNX2_9FLAO|nr:hypothetical protein DRF60_06835 [Chryseobacterium elymi]